MILSAFSKKWSPIELFVALLLSYTYSNAVFRTPDNARLDWWLESTKRESLEFYRVEEYVDRIAQNVHLTVYEAIESEYTSYLRINRPGRSLTGAEDDVSLIMIDHTRSICRKTQLDLWQLRDLFEVFSLLKNIKKLKTDSLSRDRTAIGSLALLKLVEDNAEIILYEGKYFDEATLRNLMLFRVDFPLKSGGSLRIICTIPVEQIDRRVIVETPNQPLSTLATSNLPKKIVVLTFDSADDSQLNSRDLIEKYEGFSTRLVVNYDFIEQRSAYKHLGAVVSSAREKNPFKLPVGIGCGMISGEQFTKVDKVQFSGLMRVSGSGIGEIFVAYDQVSQHLRIDHIGQDRIIYNAQDSVITYIREDSLREDDILTQYELRLTDTCASGSIIKTAGWSSLETMVDVIGLGPTTYPMYLGNARLEDGTLVMVYEREVTIQNVPFLLKVNMRSLPKVERLFLVFYFVKEYSASVDVGKFGLDSDDFQMDGLWLKQVELVSSHPGSGEISLHLQIIFSQFTWTLSAMPEQSDTDELQHPVRVFDTIRCKSMHEQLKIDLVLARNKSMDEEYTFHQELLMSKANKLEEALMVFLLKKTSIARSDINEMGIKLIDTDDTQDRQNMLVQAKISVPSGLVYTSIFVGLLEEIPGDISSMIDESSKNWLTRQEFVLQAGLEIAKTLDQKEFHFLFCPQFHFARVLADVSKLNITKKEGSFQLDTSESCELHRARLIDNTLVRLSDKFMSPFIEFKLKEAEFVADLNSRATGIYRASVLSASVNRGLDERAIGNVISSGYCFKDSTRTRQLNISVVEFTLESHLTITTCHRACDLHPNCYAYSYNKRSKTCALTDAESEELDQLVKVIDDDCTQYQPHFLLYYQQTGYSNLVVPAFLQTNNHVFVSSIENCARICHQYELRQTDVEDASNQTIRHIKTHCRSFSFMLSVSTCIISKSEIPALRKQEQLELAAETANSAYPSASYDRYYDYFVTQKGFTTNSASKSNVITIKDSQLRLSRIRESLPISLEECKFRCAVIEQSCIMFDFCQSYNLIVRNCTLFQLVKISDESREDVQYLDVLTNEGISHLQIKRSLETTGDNLQPDVSRYVSCQHNQLSEDYLAAKRAYLIAQKRGTQSPSVVDEVLHDDPRSDEHLGSAVSFLDRFQLLLYLCTLLFGVSIGSIIFISRPLMRENYLSNVISGFLTRDFHLKLARIAAKRSKNRSNSCEELRELEDM